MPAITGTAGTAPRSRNRKAARPRNADTGDRARARPVQETGKVRMYAHPQRARPQQAMRESAAAERRQTAQRQAGLEREATKARRLQHEVSRLHVTPGPSPDARDSTRSPAQRVHDRAAVDTAVRESRQKAVAKRHHGQTLAGTVEKSLVGPGGLYGPGGPNRSNVISAQEEARYRRKGWVKKGTRISTLSGRDSRGVGATVGVRTIATGGPAQMALAVGVAASQDPKGVTVNTAKGLKDMAVGAPAALVKAATDPVGTVKETVKDYKRRYGDLGKAGGFGRTVERIKKEGAAPELADAVSIGVPAGKVADLVGGRAARAGLLGSRIERKVSAPRPEVRTSGATTRPQARSRGLTAALRETRTDRKAREAVVREVSRADDAAVKEAGRVAGRPVDPRANLGKVDAVVREAHSRGEVVPTRRSARPGRRVVSQRQLRRAQQGGYAREKGMYLHAERAEQRTEIFRGSNKTLAGLNPKEQRAFKYAMQTGATTPAEAHFALGRMQHRIEQTRKRGEDTSNVGTDELPAIATIMADLHGHFTPRLERAVKVEMERGARVGEGDPGLGKTATERAETAEARRLAPQADMLGVKRGGTPVKEAIKRADEQVKVRQRARDKAARVRDRAAERRAAAEGYAQHGVDAAKRAIDHQIARAEHIVTVHEAAVASWTAREARARTPHTRAEYAAKARKARARVARAKSNVKTLHAQKDAIRVDYRRAVSRARGKERNAQREVDRHANEVRAAGDAARSVRRQERAGASLIGAEPVKDFQRRVRATARANDLRDPGFYPSVQRERTRFSLFTIGGARRTKADRGYTGKLFRAGREDASITTYTQGYAKNIKRKYNWKLVADTISAHAFEWSKGPKTKTGALRGMKYGQIENELAKRGIDPESVRIVDMDAFDDGALSSGALHTTLSGSMDDAAINAAAALKPGGGRLVVLPKHVAEELLADTKPSGALGRSLDIVKGKSARIMLGLSPAWLQFQVGANGFQTLMATKSLPHEWVIANVKWWHGLSDAQKKALEPYVGIGSFHDAIDTPKMGAAATGGLVNSYRAMKAHPFWHKPRGGALAGRSVSQLNPLDTLFRLDNAQNNFFRKAVLYNNLRRQAYERMGKSMVDGQRAFDKFLGTAGADAKTQMDALVSDRAALEQAAQSVSDFLGDYSTYTSRERRWLSRNVMFYGYMRWSLRFTFYTMPVKHPVMTAIIGQLGGMNAREVRELLGGDELPWALGKIYFTKGGKLQSVDLSRANPFANAVTQLKVDKGAIRASLLSAVGFLPPIYGALLNTAYGKVAFKDKDLKVDGESSARPNKAGQSITDSQAARIFAKQMLELAAPIRTLTKVRADGRPVSDDSLPLVHERYTTYKDPKIRHDVQVARDDETTGGRLLHELVPVLPAPNRDPETAGKIRRAQGKKSVGAAASAQVVDPATQSLIDYYRDAGPAASAAPTGDELQTLIDTYGGG